MNKKYLSIFIVLLIIAILVIGCSSRDLSKPSTRLVGHWAYFPIEDRDDPELEEYFGALDEDSVGSVVLIGGDPYPFYAQYRVLSESGDTVTIELFIGTDPIATRSYEVAKDGQSMMYRNLEYQYIDSKAKP